MNSRKVVVYSGSGYPGLGLIRCLGEAGYRPECYCYGDTSGFMLISKYVSKKKLFKNAKEVLDYLLNNYPCYKEKPILFTFPDLPAYYVDQHLDQLKDKFILMSAGKQGELGKWMDKRVMARIAEKHGLTLPWTIELSKDEPIPDNIPYPVFTKSIRSIDGGKSDEGICRNKEELERKRAQIVSDRLLVTEYIKKKLEIDYYGITVKGKTYIDFHDEIPRFPEDSFGFYAYFKRNQEDEICRKCVAMMEEIGYDGLFDVEFLLGENGTYYFMEINFRVDGCLYKLSPGVNLPAEWCRLVDVEKENLPETLQIKKESFTSMTELSDFKVSVLSGQVNVFRWLWELCTTDKLFLFNLKDPLPAFVLVWDLLSGKFRNV